MSAIAISALANRGRSVVGELRLYRAGALDRLDRQLSLVALVWGAGRSERRGKAIGPMFSSRHLLCCTTFIEPTVLKTARAVSPFSWVRNPTPSA
jgi:hypothetical protein